MDEKTEVQTGYVACPRCPAWAVNPGGRAGPRVSTFTHWSCTLASESLLCVFPVRPPRTLPREAAATLKPSSQGRNLRVQERGSATRALPAWKWQNQITNPGSLCSRESTWPLLFLLTRVGMESREMLPALPSCLIISEPTPSATATQNPHKDTGGVRTNPH